MRFLHTIPSADPALGGPIEAMNRLGAALESRGHTTEIVSTDPPTAAWLDASPLKIHALGPIRGASLGAGVRRYSYAPNLLPWLRARGQAYDVVVVHGLWQYLSFAAWSAFQGGAVPYVVYPHGMLDPWFKRRYPVKHLKKWLYWPWADYRLLRDARCVVFTSDEERVLARESFWLYRAQEEVIRYGTADPLPVDPDAHAQFLEAHPMLAGREVVLYLSRITRKKGCDLVIRAFAEAVAGNPELRLVMAGPDENYRDDLVLLAAELGVGDKIVWPGKLAGNLKWGAFATASAFILCSHQENFGVAVAEALACWVPVLISDKVNIHREISEARAGLVAPDTLDGARQLFSGWGEMGVLERAAMGRRARALFLSSFGVEGMADSFLGIIERRVLGATR